MPIRPIRPPAPECRAAPEGMWVSRDGAQHRAVAWSSTPLAAPTVRTRCGLFLSLAVAPDPAATPCVGCR